MLNKTNIILEHLRRLRLSNEEAKVYVELLRSPKTHLKVSRITGIDRSKVYRIVSDLEKRSLVTRRTDDRGTFLTASDPSSLEIEIVSHEEVVKQQRQHYNLLIPLLTELQESSESNFAIRTYEGFEGFKQMIWHELKTKNGLAILGSGDLEDLLPEHRLAHKYRSLNVKGGFRIRKLVNNMPLERRASAAYGNDFLTLYRVRSIPSEQVSVDANQTVIYNDTVAVYYWRNDNKVGVEIVNQAYAQMMRQMFEEFWRKATPLTLIVTPYNSGEQFLG